MREPLGRLELLISRPYPPERVATSKPPRWRVVQRQQEASVVSALELSASQLQRIASVFWGELLRSAIWARVMLGLVPRASTPLALVATLLTSSAGVAAPANPRPADNCVAAPNSSGMPKLSASAGTCVRPVGPRNKRLRRRRGVRPSCAQRQLHPAHFPSRRRQVPARPGRSLHTSKCVL
jgi:hypothetical protein